MMPLTIRLNIAALSTALMTLAASPLVAEDIQPTGCGAFKWSIERETASFADADLRRVKSGVTLAGSAEQAFELELEPHAMVKFAVPPEREPKAETPYSGIVTIDGNASEGSYQVTLSDRSWADVVAGGKLVPSTSSTMDLDCPIARKSVRFDLPKGAFMLQISGVPSARIKVAIRKSPQ